MIRAFIPVLLISLGSAPPDAQSAADDSPPPARTFYIAPDGDDGNNGAAGSPFATLERARDAARAFRSEAGRDAAIAIYLRGGDYAIGEPVAFAPGDSGTAENPLLVASAPGESARITGGKRIEGWREGDGGVWTAEIPEARNGGWRFNQLYVNGELRKRARIPNEGFLRVAGFPDGGREVHYHTDCQRFEYAPGDLNPEWAERAGAEVIVYHFWTDSHLPIESIDPETRIVTFKHKAGKVFTDDFTSEGARYVVENVIEGLDRPGEWVLDEESGVLRYIPMPGEDMRAAEIIAPRAPAFLRLEGDPMKREYVEHIRFENLTFEHTHWRLPPGNSNDRQGSSGVPAAIELRGARHCAFERCAVQNTGTFAFDIMEGCSDNRVARCVLRNLAAGGIRIGGGDEESHPLLRTGGNAVTDNRIHHYGEIYPSAVGVLLTHAFGNRVRHNHIHHGWYTGVSVGWEWGYQRSVSRDNLVEYNHIHDIGQGLLSDMGAVYTLGVSPGTKIRNNLIHHIDANHYGGWGIYNDEGSTHILIENNIVHDTKFACYNIHFCKEVTLRNNIFAFGRLQQLSRSRAEPHKSVYFENNIVYWTEGELLDKNWRDKEYEFYFHPKNDSGIRVADSTFDMDWNVYYNPELRLEEVDFNGMAFSEWRAAGKDAHSLYADPGFADPAGRDFALSGDSPAAALGFEPIGTASIGPRGPVGPAPAQ